VRSLKTIWAYNQTWELEMKARMVTGTLDGKTTIKEAIKFMLDKNADFMDLLELERQL